MSSYKSPIGLPDEHMRLVGIIAAHWEHVDLILQRAIAEVMELDFNRVAHLTANIGFNGKRDILMVYARPLEVEYPPDWLSFKRALEGVSQAYAARNRYVHAAWEVRGEDIYRHTIRTSGGKLAQTDTLVTVADLAAAAHQIVAAGGEFARWMQEHGLLQPKP